MSPPRRTRENRLNALNWREWLLFQKSWFIHNPPPREKGVLTHPAKFPESLCQEFIEFFTKPGELVFDPMAGTGSALVAALRSGRRGLGIELMPKYAEISQQRLAQEHAARVSLFDPEVEARVICGDARETATLVAEPVDYVLTSPPYWDMLRRAGFETQRRRRADEELDVWYSEEPNDVGNIAEYETFLDELVAIYRAVAEVMRPHAYATLIVKNVKKGGRVFPLAWDLGRRVGEFLALRDEKIWCQDNQRLAPYGMGYAWVSNTMHHYCLNFRKE
jgi:DNA modification methylase